MWSSNPNPPKQELIRSLARFLHQSPRHQIIHGHHHQIHSSLSTHDRATHPSQLHRVVRRRREREPTPTTVGRKPLVGVPGALWRWTLRPLGYYGFGGRSVWEGGVGLFMDTGATLLALALAWLRGFQLRSCFRKYQAVFEFTQACGICVGTPVRIRGVPVGSIVRVDSSLERIAAYAEPPNRPCTRNTTSSPSCDGLHLSLP